MVKPNYERFLESFSELKNLFPNEGGSNGYNRLAFSDRERKTHIWLEEKLAKSGIQVKRDSIGNSFGRVGSNGGAAVGVGSHIDTVPHGGLYDGAYGTLAALEVVRTLADNNISIDHDVLFTCFVGEEVNPLGGTFGSRAVNGEVPLVENKYFTKEQLSEAILPAKTYKNFIELHIEQSKSLEERGLTIGIPTAIAGILRYEYSFFGESLHAGATMMEYRDDALVKASRFVQKVYELAFKHKKSLVATVGKLVVFPGTPTVIPGLVKLTLEIRSVDIKKMYDFKEKLDNWLKTTNYKSEQLVIKKSAHLSQDVENTILLSAQKLRYASTKMISGANHDVNAMSRNSKAGLIFVPSHKGVSHNPNEFTSEEDLIAGLNVLYETITKLAN